MIFQSFFITITYPKDKISIKKSIFHWKIKLIYNRSEFWHLKRKQLSFLKNSRFRHVKDLKMTVWTSVFWKITIQMAKKWSKIVKTLKYIIVIWIESEYTLVLFLKIFIMPILTHFFLFLLNNKIIKIEIYKQLNF